VLIILKKHTHMRTSLALAAAGLLLAASPVLAAGRDERPPRDGGAIVVPAPVIVPAPALPLFGGSSRSSGTISSNTSVSTNSGGNTGGNVVTGDQSSSVSVVNIGPTSNDSTVIIAPGPSDPAPEPQCTGRACPRTR
jgi:hypothetical protein